MDKLISWFDEKRGRRLALAEALGLAPATITGWKNVPAEHARAIEACTGISRYELRPDIFGPDPASEKPERPARSPA